jgi:hypothetical protein
MPNPRPVGADVVRALWETTMVFLVAATALMIALLASAVIAPLPDDRPARRLLPLRALETRD